MRSLDAVWFDPSVHVRLLRISPRRKAWARWSVRCKTLSGATIANASVTVTEVGKGFTRTAATDSSGFYVLNSLPPAQYDLSVESSGFHTFESKGSDAAGGPDAYVECKHAGGWR